MIKLFANRVRKLAPALAAAALLAGCGSTLSEVPIAHMEHPPLVLPQSGMNGPGMMAPMPEPSIMHGGQFIGAPMAMMPIQQSMPMAQDYMPQQQVMFQQQIPQQQIPQQQMPQQQIPQQQMPQQQEMGYAPQQPTSYTQQNYYSQLSNPQPAPYVIQQPPIVVQQPPITIQQPAIMVQSPKVVLRKPQIDLKPPTIIQNQPTISYSH
ncbi:MAG: hypothetical protein HQL54_00125 [Magnetococcales bacterium]|nr:hypothetical protein [Magnetococcales bacterium]